MKKNLFVALFLSLALNSFTQDFYIFGGYGYSIVPNYNDDKGSEHFPEENYLGAKGYLKPNFGVGYKFMSNRFVHTVEGGYKVIGGLGSYKGFDRPWFYVPGGGSLTRVVEYQEQGLYSPMMYISYSIGHPVTSELDLSAGLSLGFPLQARLYYLLKADVEVRRHWSGAGKLYFRKINPSVQLRADYKLSKLFSVKMSYEYFVSSINTMVDIVIIRPYHPHYFSLGVVIYNIQ